MSTTPPTGQPSVPAAAETPAPVSPVFVNLPLGKPLEEAGASEVLRGSGAPIVVLAGAVKSGKTTLLASLHDAFQRTPFAGYLCAGSRTLLGLEEECFDARFASGGETPVTQRTKLEEGILFYHLKELLLADMSGEHYEGALDSAAALRGLTIEVRKEDLRSAIRILGRKLASIHQVNKVIRAPYRCWTWMPRLTFF
jgi:Double-GTPase 2